MLFGFECTPFWSLPTHPVMRRYRSLYYWKRKYGALGEMALKRHIRRQKEERRRRAARKITNGS